MPTTTSRHPLTGLVLRPGTHVLRRSADELQVGLDPRRAVVLADLPATRSLLDALANPAAVPDGDVDPRALELLRSADLVVDADLLLPLVPSGPVEPRSPSAPGRPDVSALAAYAGERAPAHVAARARADIGVLVTGGPESHAVATLTRTLLAEAGVGSHLASDATTVPTAVLLVCVGEPPRESVDILMRESHPHLLLRLTEGNGVVGPFVVPGRTACLRCVDAHHTDHDPAWPLLLTQYASAVTRERADSLAEPVDTLLATLTAAWAARELTSYVEGQTPATTSTTVRLDPWLTSLETHTWPRHPACGCSWA